MDDRVESSNNRIAIIIHYEILRHAYRILTSIYIFPYMQFAASLCRPMNLLLKITNDMNTLLLLSLIIIKAIIIIFITPSELPWRNL